MEDRGPLVHHLDAIALEDRHVGELRTLVTAVVLDDEQPWLRHLGHQTMPRNRTGGAPDTQGAVDRLHPEVHTWTLHRWRDPGELGWLERKGLIEAQRMIGVLKAVAKKFGWTPAVSPSGRGIGVACGIDAGSYVATIVEVDVEKKSGVVRVKRVVAAGIASSRGTRSSCVQSSTAWAGRSVAKSRSR